MRTSFPLALVASLGLLACESESTSSCGAGTVLEAGACVPDPSANACGPGTVLEGGICVLAADGTDAVDATDTVDGTDGTDATDTSDGTDATDATDGADGVDSSPPPPASWTCDDALYGSGGDCDCACGALDLDCLMPGSVVKGCSKTGAVCGADGQCAGGAPTGWTCAPWRWDDGAHCECECGLPDPDCQDPQHPTIGCFDGGACASDGTCAPCTPNCDGKSCGSDGCGGSCGSCLTPGLFVCNQGTCAAECVPACDGRECGPDGCGGTCGECTAGSSCKAGHCDPLSADLSCKDHCGGTAPGGCRCDASCLPGFDCCDDRAVACGCLPNCTGRVCGDDGCGGSCGTCTDGEACLVNGQCLDDPCLPDPCGGNGLCLADGSCACSIGYTGAGCDTCMSGFTGYPDCKVDLCAGVDCGPNGTCDPVAGCVCQAGYAGPTCSDCAPGYDGSPLCLPTLPAWCGGTLCAFGGICDPYGSGACVCSAGFEGGDCGSCADPGASWPECGPPDCNLLHCNGFGTCTASEWDGPCACNLGFSGPECTECDDPGAAWPNCGI